MSANVFPLTFQSHMIFCIIAVAFFIFQYVRTKSAYQLLTIFAVLATQLSYVSDSKKLFYGTGIFELVMLIAIGITSAMARKKNPENKESEEINENQEIEEAKEVTEDENSNS